MHHKPFQPFFFFAFIQTFHSFYFTLFFFFFFFVFNDISRLFAQVFLLQLYLFFFKRIPPNRLKEDEKNRDFSKSNDAIVNKKIYCTDRRVYTYVTYVSAKMVRANKSCLLQTCLLLVRCMQTLCPLFFCEFSASAVLFLLRQQHSNRARYACIAYTLRIFVSCTATHSIQLNYSFSIISINGN